MSQNNSSNEERREIVPDGPEYRSVPMLARPMAVPLRTGFVAPNKAVVNDGVAASKELMTTPMRSKDKEQPRWKVVKPLAIPSYYELEKTHIVVPGVSALELSARIDECFRQESIAATFDNDQALVKAETGGCLKFAVRLWQAPKDATGIVVEVQRTKGCSFLFKQTVKTLFHRAKFGDAPTTMTAPRSIPRCVPELPDSVWEESTKEGLELASSALQKKESTLMDAHLLAAESLVQLTKASKCRAFCAQNILSVESDILPVVLSLVQIAAEEEYDGLEGEHLELMHRNALHILANCLEVAQSSGDLAAVVDQIKDLTSEATLTALVDDVRKADRKPHEAAHACRCLKALCRNGLFKQRAVEMGAGAHVSAASLCRHAVLEEESSKLLQDL